MTDKSGMVFLVGAGPGDPGLITVKGLEALRIADVVLHDRLSPVALLDEARPDAEIIDVGKSPGVEARSQPQINRLLVEKAREGNVVVRLKGGDPFVFGRGGEELAACRKAGIDCVVIPGVSSAIAVPAAAGIALTARGIGRSFAVITGRTEDEDALPEHDYEALAKIDTIVVMMGRDKLGRIAAALIEAGRDPQTPAACIASGTTPRQRGVVATLATIAQAADRERLEAPVVTVIGETVGIAPVGDMLPGGEEAHRLLAGASLRGAAGPTGEWTGLREADGLPLSGRRVAITQARSTSSELRRLLDEAGAEVVHCPLIEITYPQEAPECDEAVQELARFDWTVFTSVHGVRGFWQRMEALGRDARAFGACRVAAVGPGTARELASHGIRADLVPDEATAASLVKALRGSSMSAPDRSLHVFFPHGNLALPTVAEGLRAVGAVVREAIVYVTQAATPPRSAVMHLQAGVDAILFCSPSAVERFAKLELTLPGALVGCIGPTTASAARAAGLGVDVVPERPGSAGLVAALAEHLQAVGAER